jgi:hypothetical protein
MDVHHVEVVVGEEILEEAEAAVQVEVDDTMEVVTTHQTLQIAATRKKNGSLSPMKTNKKYAILEPRETVT